jgi:uncharacterized SAM-binding protein YcdF (DUF218 family)
MTDEHKPSRLRRWAFFFLTVVTLGATYFGNVYYQVSRQAQIDEARPVDVIVVLGAAQYWGRPSPVLRARLDHALELYRRDVAPRIITTGGVGEGASFSESEVSREYLSEQGVPAEFVTVETEGKSTIQSSLIVAEIMDRMELRSCVVVSDDYHIFRVKRVFESLGIEVYGSPRRGKQIDPWRKRWFYARESLGYILWRVGVHI